MSLASYVSRFFWSEPILLHAPVHHWPLLLFLPPPCDTPNTAGDPQETCLRPCPSSPVPDRVKHAVVAVAATGVVIL